MDYDLILEELGEFGLWQILIALMLWLPPFTDGVQIMLASVAGANAKQYRCKMRECSNDDGSYYPVNESLFFPTADANDKPDRCRYFQPDSRPDGTCDFSNLTTHSDVVVSCGSQNEYFYQKFELDNSWTTDFNIVCERSVLEPAVNSFFMIGLMVGSFVFGVLSDKFGRRHMLAIAIVVANGASLIGAFMPEYYSFAFCRFLAGVGAEGTFLIPFTFSMEIVGIKERIPLLHWVTYTTLLANFISIPLAAGESIVSALGYGIKDWRTLQWVASVVCLSTVLIWFFIPESPRWLISNKQYKKARAIIAKAEKRNGVSISSHHFSSIQPEVESKATDGSTYPQKENTEFSLRQIFHPSVRMITVVMFVCWPVITLLYYGISLSVDKIGLSDDVLLSYILVAVVEIPSYIFLVLLMDVWGRKPLFVLSMLVPGVCCLGAAFLNSGALFTVLVLLGKFCAAAAFNITYMYTAELYPTPIRNTAVGLCSTMARFGGISAPWFAVYLPGQGSIPEWVSYTVFGILAFLGGILALFLPDTLGFGLPDTFEDLEEMKRGSKPLWKCVCGTRAEEPKSE